MHAKTIVKTINPKSTNPFMLCISAACAKKQGNKNSPQIRKFQMYFIKVTATVTGIYLHF